MYSKARRSQILGLILIVAGSGTAPIVFAEEDEGSSQDNPATGVKKTFAATCASCHANYGMRAGTGPKLAGTRMTEEQIFERIWNGKQGTTHAFKKVLSEAQAQALASYIKGLPSN